ncbi:MAG: O-antigen ligase family protein [Anaerolineae bacterium]|nr:O-antigen ligase family protein [Anaerolineae bacterium]
MIGPDSVRLRRLRRWQAAVVVCVLCLVGVSGPTWRAWRVAARGVERQPGEEDGLQFGTQVTLEQYDAQAVQRALDDVVSLGFTWVRQRFPWHAIEPRRGQYDWAQWDAIVAAVDARGLGLVAVLDAPPAWAMRHDPVPLPCVPPCPIDAYARYVGAFAARYGPQIDHYQVWDEPNLSRAWGGGHAAPCGYAALLEAAYHAIHAADPSSQVLGAALAPTQAPGPADLNDLVYLRQLLAAGGGAHMDLLAVKLYGFWSGPDDRRVALDVLNASRVVAARELMRSRGAGDVGVWAVEWGWNALPQGWAGGAAPWGTDSAAVQGTRILASVARAHKEWPWLDAMCWVAYQPDLPSDDPTWGFALRDAAGQETPRYAVLAAATQLEAPETVEAAGGARWTALGALLTLGYVCAGGLWRRVGLGGAARRAWRRWRALAWPYHLALLCGLGVLYAVTPWAEWALLELALGALLLTLHPHWGLIGAVGAIPFFYAAKPLGPLYLAASETLLVLATPGLIGRWVRRRAVAPSPQRWSALDVVWAAWVAWNTAAVTWAPDPGHAWHEWRMCVLGPALLYVLVRVEARWRDPHGAGVPVRSLAIAWVGSGVAVALVGVVQWLTGALVPAGSVGRVTGVYYSPNHLALYLERVWPLALAVAGMGLDVRHRRWTWGAAVAIGLGLYLTYSRGAWLLAVPAALCVIGWSVRRRLRWWVVGGAGVALLLVASNVVLGRAASPSVLLDTVRVSVWQSTLHMIADHAWLGVGLDGYRTVYPRYMQAAAWTEPLLYHPHNAWLDAAVRTGVPGLAIHALLIALVLRRAFRCAQAAPPAQQALAVGCAAGIVAGLAHGLVDSGYYLPDLAWSLALAGAMASAAPDLAMSS